MSHASIREDDKEASVKLSDENDDTIQVPASTVSQSSLRRQSDRRSLLQRANISNPSSEERLFMKLVVALGLGDALCFAAALKIPYARVLSAVLNEFAKEQSQRLVIPAEIVAGEV